MTEHELQTLSEPFPSSLANLQPNNDPIESKQGKRKEQKNPNKRPPQKKKKKTSKVVGDQDITYIASGCQENTRSSQLYRNEGKRRRSDESWSPRPKWRLRHKETQQYRQPTP
jgi:hypothetical protein